jgi:GTP-binding protein LepA
MMDQVLDSMDLEREKGITIKSHAIQMVYEKGGEKYILNLIDTPGHVDFSYEVSRAISSCEGALLVVDAAQGIEAQTISNLYLAIEHNLEIIPVLNKIDLPSARVEEVSDEIIGLVGCKREDIVLASAKEGIGIEEILDQIVARIPAPSGKPDAPLKALIFDAVFNPYRGTIVYFRVFDGQMRFKDKVTFMATGAQYEVDEVGILRLGQQPVESVETGSVGYLVAGIKNL